MSNLTKFATKKFLRQAAELGVSMTVLTTLLTGCLGGGGSSVVGGGGGSAGNMALNATPALGAFRDGSTVVVFDHLGVQCAIGLTAGGVAALTIDTNTCIAPLTVQAGKSGDWYFNEATSNEVQLVGNGVRAVLPAATSTPFGVTALTEIAAAGLLNASGVVNTNAAGVTARNNTIASILSNGNVTDPLAVPQAAGVGKQASNVYGALLAMLANLVPGKNAQDIVNGLALDIGDGTWDGLIGTGSVAAISSVTPSAATFGASMVAAADRALVSINAVSAPVIAFSNAYLPGSDVAATITATVANNGVVPPSPINTAKNMFTSLRTSLNLLTNSTQTGFFDTQAIIAKNDLRNSIMPNLNQTMSKIAVLNDGINLLDTLKTTGLSVIPSCSSVSFASLCQSPATIPANVIVTSVSFRNVSWNTCTTSIPATFSGGVLPIGQTAMCGSQIDPVTFTATGYSFNTFNGSVTSTATANSFTYSSTSTSEAFDFMGTATNVPTTSPVYSGMATVVKMPAGISNASLAVSGQLAADGVNHAYEQIAINMTRTYPFGTTPVGAPSGFFLAKYDATGSISNMLANGTTTGTIALLTGSSTSNLEDVNGGTPLGATSTYYLGHATTAVLQAQTVNTQIDGTLIASNTTCDLSGFNNCSPSNMSFTGSITNLADKAVGTFFTGTLTDTRDLTSYDATRPLNVTLAATGKLNRIRDIGVLSGTVTNNTVTPAAVYQVTSNGDGTVDNQNTVGVTYRDAANNTVTISSVVNTNASSGTPRTLTASSGTIIAELTVDPAAVGTGGTRGLTGNVYAGTVAPANKVGVIAGNKITYSDGTFATLQ